MDEAAAEHRLCGDQLVHGALELVGVHVAGESQHDPELLVGDHARVVVERVLRLSGNRLAR